MGLRMLKREGIVKIICDLLRRILEEGVMNFMKEEGVTKNRF